MVAEIVVAGDNSEAAIVCELPMTKVTAIVSPSARPRPSITPPTTPIRVYGNTILFATSQVVQPMPYAASFRTGGTVEKTSRDIEVTKGRTMIARISEAVSSVWPKYGVRVKKPQMQ